MPQVSDISLLSRSPLFNAPRSGRPVAVAAGLQQEKTSWVRRWPRGAFRLMWFCTTLALAAVDFIRRIWFCGRPDDRRIRSEWCMRWAQALLRCLNIHAEYIGEPPRAGLLVCNHLSYLDIVVLAARQPMVFVSKAEVRHWPVIGWLAQQAGTLFIRREKRGDVSPLNQQVAALVEAGIVVVVFPEGTSSDGHSVLPFYSSLLQPAVARGCAVTPAFIRYALADGSVEEEVCYWRDMTFGPHFLNLLTKHEIRVQVRLGATHPVASDRKRLARELRERVCLLGGGAAG